MGSELTPFRLSDQYLSERHLGDEPRLVFLHANGYPPGSYRQLLEGLAGRFRVDTIEHRPLWSKNHAPKRLDWQVYADDLLMSLEKNIDAPVWLVGHSMGAVVSMLAAAQRPDLVTGLVAIDPVLLPLKFWLPMQLMARLFAYELPMAKVALNRPHRFAHVDEAFTFYRAKRPFRRLSDQSLWDYVHAGHEQAADGGIRLRWSGAWEACVYRSAPSIFRKLKAMRAPLLGIVGRESDVITPELVKLWQAAMPALAVEQLEGGHLLPLEAPAECAQRVITFIDQYLSVGQAMNSVEREKR